jgi:hypothetical protein
LNGVAKQGDSKSSEAEDRAADVADQNRHILDSVKEGIERNMGNPDTQIGLMGAVLISERMGLTRDDTSCALRSLGKVSQATRCVLSSQSHRPAAH